MTRRFMVKFVAAKNDAYAVFDETGKQVSGASAHRAVVEDMADRLTRRAQAKNRPCITCRDEFNSEGPHNRMCDKCRQRGHTVDMRMMAG